MYDITVKPVYNGRLYRGHPVYNGYLAISQAWPLYTGYTVRLYMYVHYFPCSVRDFACIFDIYFSSLVVTAILQFNT